MKTSTLFLAPAAVAAQWFAGAPECAQTCLSSAWDQTTSTWPEPSAFCAADAAATVSSCLDSACSATSTAWASYSSLSSSLCGDWASCSSAGSTGVFTTSAPGFVAGPGSGGGGSVYTVTGCEWDGSPWNGGPHGWGPGGGASGSPWGDWGAGWTWHTYTRTVTQVVTLTATNGALATSASTGLATVAEAVSGSVTSTTTLLSAKATGNAASGAGAGSGGSHLGVKAVGAILGGVVAVAGLL